MDASVTLDLDTLWAEALAEVVDQVTSPPQRRWLTETQPVGYSDGTVVLAAPHSFARAWLDTRCSAQLRAALSRVAGDELAVVITVRPDPRPLDGDAPADDLTADREPDPGDDRSATPLDAPGRPPGPIAAPADGRDGAPLGRGTVSPKYTFERFVPGASNRFAYAAACAVAEAPARAYNPLFIYGDAGLGKTHLLHAIGNEAAHLYQRMQVVYVTTEQFTNEFISAIQSGRYDDFRRRYRQADILLVDDIQFLERGERTQEEFFHTFNALYNAERQIVISSDRPPAQIQRLEERLRTRFEWSLVADVQPPDLETRLAILRRNAAFLNLQMGDDVLEFIATRVQRNIRELEGALIRVTAYASLQRTKVDLALAEVVLKDVVSAAQSREIGVPLIMDEVAEYFHVSSEDLSSPSRTKQLVNARQIAMYLVRELTDRSLPQIGKAFGRDHTTVMHARDKITTLMQERQATYDQVQELTNRIRTKARVP